MKTKRDLTVKEAAAQLGISTSAVHQAISAGTLEAERVGWQWLIPKRFVDAYKPRPYKRKAKLAICKSEEGEDTGE